MSHAGLVSPPESTEVLRIDQVTVRRRARTVVDVADLTFGLGCTVVTGANGSGKSSLLGALAGLVPATCHASVDGRTLTTAEGRRSIGFLPQHPDGLDHLTVAEVVRFAALLLAGATDHAKPHAVAQLLSRLGIEHLASRRIAALSGGERQLAYLAASVATEPPVLLLDEPTVGLDAGHRQQLREMVLLLGRSTAVVLVSHLADDIALLGALRTVVMAAGSVRFDGTAEELAAQGRGHDGHHATPIDAALSQLDQDGQR